MSSFWRLEFATTVIVLKIKIPVSDKIKNRPSCANRKDGRIERRSFMANTQLQLQTGFIDRLADTDVIPQRITDGYFNATAMCRSAGKKISHYLSNSTTRDFIQELSSNAGIPASDK